MSTENKVVAFCVECGAEGAHFCVGREFVTEAESMEAMNAILLLAAAPTCRKHKRYQAIRKPRVNCEACWRQYIYFNP